MKKSSANETKKHVIILGAGASVTSGYPVANELRLLLMSRQKVEQRIRRVLEEEQEELPDTVFQGIVRSTFGGAGESTTQLFRQGGFATVDEFSSLANSQYPHEIQILKNRLCLVLGIHNPEHTFEKSDYYPFIQKLFHRGIYPLRNDVAILTFNYDPYLPFLLSRAAEVRFKASGKKSMGNAEHCLTSGFDGRDLRALEEGKGLCLLQLHGMTAWPRRHDDERVIDFHHLFYDSSKYRLEKVASHIQPAIVFPWEVISDKGQFRSKTDFCLNERCDGDEKRQGGYIGPNDLHDLFTSIWKRAQKEVGAATKISFVGLSMHEFLNPAFKFLFKGKRIPARIVCANKDLERFRSVDEANGNPRSPVCKVRRLLKKICPHAMAEVNSDGMANVRRRETFAEFIEYEMD